MSKILVISDTHITPGMYPNKSFWYNFGVYCTETKPDYIIHLGDVGDFDSQAWLVKNRGKYSLAEEIAEVSACFTNFQAAIKDYNNIKRKQKKKTYRPKQILTLGNHDVRNGITVVADLFTQLGWEVYDYCKPAIVDGISFVHCAHKGLSDTVCNTAQELLENWHTSIVVGHGHHKDFFESCCLETGKKLTALRSPVFLLTPADWAVQTKLKWSQGFTEINTDPFSFVWRDMECLLKIS